MKTVFAVLASLMLCMSMLTFMLQVQPAKTSVIVSTDDDWSMFQHDLAHTGVSLSVTPRTNSTLWTFDAGCAITVSPAVANGFVYFGTWNDNFYALNASTGALVWKYKTGNSIVGSSPAVADGVVYIGSEDGYLYALNASAGTLIWRSRLGEFVDSSAAVVNGVVYEGSSLGNGISALDTLNGNIMWSYDTMGDECSSPAIVNGVLFTGCLNGNVYALNAAEGTLIWNYQTGSYLCAPPSVFDGVVYIQSNGNSNVPKNYTTFALDASTGALLWTYPTGGDSCPAVSNGLMYIGGSDGKFRALNANTGTCVWSYPTGFASSPAIADGLVFVGDANWGKVYALDALSGTLVWSYETDGAISSSPTVSNGVVYIGSDDGKLYAFGQPAFSVAISHSYSSLEVGSTQYFDSNVSGGVSPYTYQWCLNGLAVSGANGQTWSFTPESAGSNYVNLEVTDASNAFSTSDTISFTVNEPNSTSPPTNNTLPQGGSTPTPGANVYFSVEPVATSPLNNINESVNGLEVPETPSPIGQEFTINIHLRNATANNVAAGVAGLQVDFDFANILNYCKPIGFKTMIGQQGGVFGSSQSIFAPFNGFFDANGNSVSNCNQATQYAVCAASSSPIGWNNNDGLIAQITFQIVAQPLKILNQSDFYAQLHITSGELVDPNVNEIPYTVVQGTLKIDDPGPALGGGGLLSRLQS